MRHQYRHFGAAPPEHHSLLLHARVYLMMRWLGERRDWTLSEQAHGHFEELYRLGSEAALV